MTTPKTKQDGATAKWIFGKSPCHRQIIIGESFIDSEGGHDITQDITLPYQFDWEQKQVEQLASKICRAVNEYEALLAALEEIASRGPIDGYSSAGALRLRLVATQSIARAAIAKAKGGAS